MVAPNNPTSAKNEEDAQSFETLLKQQKLSKDAAAQMFGVSLSTAWAWTSGRSSVPRAVLMVLRMRAHLALPEPWDQWHIEGGKLVAPSGRALTPDDIEALIEIREQTGEYQALLQRVMADKPAGGVR